jgi:hypothetical protein
MEKLFMSASVVVVIVLSITGIIKLPFGKFKMKHPQGFKTVFTSISFILSIGLCVLDELYILNGQLLSIDFAVLTCAVLAGVFGGYGGVYEGLGIKELIKKLVGGVKKAKALSKDKKVIKLLNKIEDIDKAIVYLEERKFNKGNEV